jgi:hypothetical protein
VVVVEVGAVVVVADVVVLVAALVEVVDVVGAVVVLTDVVLTVVVETVLVVVAVVVVDVGTTTVVVEVVLVDVVVVVGGGSGWRSKRASAASFPEAAYSDDPSPLTTKACGLSRPELLPNGVALPMRAHACVPVGPFCVRALMQF